jgi:hypothetical protein
VKKAIIVGSAPISLNLTNEDLGEYQRIAINKSWRVRRDFDKHVFLKSLPDDELPPLAAGIEPVKVGDFTPVLRNAGGLYLTSGSVAAIAGYWAVARCGVHFLNFYGCDLVFSGAQGTETHYYGMGDSGPLVGNFQYNLRQRERSIRLMYWGLLHSVIVTNSSGLDGSLLAFPKVPLHVETDELLDDILSSQETLRFLRKASNVWASEQRLRTPVFRSRQNLFESDPDAVAAMNAILDLWAELEPVALEYCERVKALFESAEQIKLAVRDMSPSENLRRQQTNFDLVLHIGTPHAGFEHGQDYLDDYGSNKDTCKVLSQKDLQRLFTKLNTSFATKDSKFFAAEQRNIQIVKNLSKRLFAELDIKAGDRLIINDENALGSLAQCGYSGKTYQSPNKFLSNFAANLPAEPVDVHVSIYNYADFFARAYANLLKRSQNGRFVPLSVFVAKVMANLPSWTATLDGVYLCFPAANVHVWCMDDPVQTLPFFLANLVGNRSLQDQIDLPAVPKNQSPLVGDQVAAFMTSLAHSGLEAVLELHSKKEWREDDTSTVFDPWSADQKAHLAKLYAEDVARIARDSRFILHGLMTPDKTV